MRFNTQIPKQFLKQIPNWSPAVIREQVEAVVHSVVPILGGIVRAAVQRTGAQVVDRAVDVLGLGRHGVRLTGSSLVTNSQRWEAELTAWTAASVAEAVEILIQRSVAPFFDILGGEQAFVEKMVVRWLQSGRFTESHGQTRAQVLAQTRGMMVLEWSTSDRELFRRRALGHLAEGTTAELTLSGIDTEGLTVVEVDVVVFARVRAQLRGKI